MKVRVETNEALIRNSPPLSNDSFGEDKDTLNGEEKKKAADQAWQDNFDMAAYERERAERRRLREAGTFDDGRLLKMETQLGI